MTEEHSPSYFLEPGYVYVSRRPVTIRAVVGSCVAVCLWDHAVAMGGMSHFVRPWAHDPNDATPRFGNAALSALVRMLEELGAKRHSMSAQILGGASPPGHDEIPLGRQNVEAAREMMRRRDIPIVGEDVEGKVGRKLAFDTGTGQLAVLKVQQLRETDWYA